ncbi:hypothetical protein GCE9029_02915 [Grimontia celer]|uniref:Copper-binding protein n=1 Tax=Grimontia celer TaxID=1796497 RepID=A0A128F576_9GAMM|nr:hypothetical protein [Grimontia celer]CZF81933.1 hypothetical protein GCE9029_02915 [Grimontia celer]
MKMGLSLVLALSTVLSFQATAKGNLSQRATDLPELVLGTDDAGFAISQKEFQMETGKAYALTITSTGAKECAFEAHSFFDNVWMRKVEAGGIEIKANGFYEIEFEDEGEIELFFVPIKPGKYAFECAGFASKGMAGTFIVE